MGTLSLPRRGVRLMMLVVLAIGAMFTLDDCEGSEGRSAMTITQQ